GGEELGSGSAWRTDYNEVRPHKSLSWQTPGEYEHRALASPERLSGVSFFLEEEPQTNTN
ncbi:MAG TPA: integrase core domain-containing protein, partial [Planctomycetota bacterium]|nr:integrase core domain-containing protein [Planctomycetota bacterium]